MNQNFIEQAQPQLHARQKTGPRPQTGLTWERTADPNQKTPTATNKQYTSNNYSTETIQITTMNEDSTYTPPLNKKINF
jgi:hypothetical protein